MFATATLLLPLSKLGMSSETTPPLLRYIEMAVEILEAMDESVVARKSVEIIKHYLRLFRASDTHGDVGIDNNSVGNGEIAPMATDIGPGLPGDEMPASTDAYYCPFADFNRVYRNGHVGLCFLIIRLKGSQGFLTSWVDFLELVLRIRYCYKQLKLCLSVLILLCSWFVQDLSSCIAAMHAGSPSTAVGTVTDSVLRRLQPP